jgi:hypothetical protein
MAHKKLHSVSTWLSFLILLATLVSVLNPARVFAATNIAQGKTASADSSQTANPAANGNDGSISTRWCAANGSTGHWWKVDLGTSQALSGSEVMWEFARNYRYKVEVSTDNVNWTLKVDKTASTSTAQTQTDAFTATARYVRITVTGLPISPTTWASFYEFRVFDATSGPTATPTRTPTASAGLQTITNDTVWKDTSNNTIYAQGGGILKVGNTYYWYGTDFVGAHDTSKSAQFLNIKAYSSTDLKNWTFRANVITQGAPGTPFSAATWAGRPDVIFNANTQKYVMLINYEFTDNGSGPNGVAFATSSSPTGTFTYAGVQTVIPNVYFDRPGDQSVFVDDDGKAYLVFCDSHGRQRAYVAPIRASDYLQIEPATQIYLYGTDGMEANNMFKRNGLYYNIVSETAGWAGSQTSYQTASNIFGPYSSLQVMSGSAGNNSHQSQTDFVLKVQGTSGTTYMYAGDRWSDFISGQGNGFYVWEPLSFNGSTPTFNNLSSWKIDAVAGTWAP